MSAHGAKKATNLTLDGGLIAEAKELGINLSQAAEAGVAAAVRETRSEQWKKRNAKALESANAYVEANGLPLEKHRLF